MAGKILWAGKDSNLRSPEATDLQSVVIDRSTTDPTFSLFIHLSHLSDSNRGPTVYKTVALTS